MITVYHNKNFLDYSLQSLTGKTPTGPLTVKKVARVNTDTLTNAFELTNHITILWEQNPGVTAFSKPNRSTSVGDVLHDSKLFHIVEPVGFRTLTAEEVASIVIE